MEISSAKWVSELVRLLSNLHFFFFFLTCPHKRGEGGGVIRTSDFCFMRHGPQPIKLLLENYKQLTLALLFSSKIVRTISNLHLLFYLVQKLSDKCVVVIYIDN
jgi:hypothetical protein